MTQPVPPDRPAYAPQPEYVEHVSRFNPVVAVLGVVAAVLGVLAITILGWYRDDNGLSSGDSHFGDVRKLVDLIKDTRGVSTTISAPYFDWLGYVLLGVAVVGALACSTAVAGAIRVLTAIVAIAGLGLTLWAIQLITVDGGSDVQFTGANGYSDWLKHTSFGAWAMMLAFILCFVAALIRPRRQRSRGY